MTLVLVALAYLTTVWLDGVGSNLPAKVTPRPWLYFAQVAALFKHAGMMVIDYRAEGWSCSEQDWVEIDVRPWFRIEANTKESRFHRTLQFYRRERKVMRALDAYVMRRYEHAGGPPIGGVRFSSLRIPYPNIGDRIEPMERKPLSAYPKEIQKVWYYTPESRRRERCREHAAPTMRRSTEASPMSSDGMSEAPYEERGAHEERRSEP